MCKLKAAVNSAICAGLEIATDFGATLLDTTRFSDTQNERTTRAQLFDLKAQIGFEGSTTWFEGMDVKSGFLINQ